MPPPRPRALSPALPSELLTYILTHQVCQTTLIICQPRAAFLTSLISSVPQPIQRQPQYTAAADLPNTSNLIPNPYAEDAVIDEPPPLHPLLIPTLHQIATSRDINLVFIPTVSHLRAYISAFPPSSTPTPAEAKQTLDKPGKEVPLLVIYGLISLHRDTSEWSAQGLGNSVSGLVEAGLRSGIQVVVIEERRADDEDTEDEHLIDEEEHIQRKARWKVWEERVPMLNGSVKRVGFESEDSAWSGRTIEVGRIFARWFTFGKGDWDVGD